ncbi:Required for meiotic nuclear division protein 1 [Desmophyllum pertusum]|uniref:Required for meiotic nuclear division protein 1 n=1 Tax=Desmophyllum pertusum TaxID=174260 RepID=A0A9X0A008_9CNID|nr:Required for meiotic nuclear division protein 1 [Desmophyllum pertusum]
MFRKCIVFSCYSVKFPLQKPTNVFNNCNFKIYTIPLSYASSGGKPTPEMQTAVPQTSKARPRTKSPSQKMRAHREESHQQGWMHCQAYVTGERYNIHDICSYLKNTAKYKITFIPEEETNVLLVRIKDKNGDNNGEVFFFRWLGSLVLWNVSNSEAKYFKETAQLFQDGGHEKNTHRKLKMNSFFIHIPKIQPLLLMEGLF